jgi:hypothetical protein
MLPLRLLVLSTLCLAVGAPDGNSPIDVVGLISHLGFPMFVSIWFMYRIEGRVDNLIRAQENLTTVVTVFVKTVESNLPVSRYGASKGGRTSPPER